MESRRRSTNYYVCPVAIISLSYLIWYSSLSNIVFLSFFFRSFLTTFSFNYMFFNIFCYFKKCLGFSKLFVPMIHRSFNFEEMSEENVSDDLLNLNLKKSFGFSQFCSMRKSRFLALTAMCLLIIVI